EPGGIGRGLAHGPRPLDPSRRPRRAHRGGAVDPRDPTRAKPEVAAIAWRKDDGRAAGMLGRAGDVVDLRRREQREPLAVVAPRDGDAADEAVIGNVE